MAFMNTPVTHGSGAMIVTGTGADTELGKIAGMLSATRSRRPRSPSRSTPHAVDRRGRGLTMVVMFALGLSRGEAWDTLFVAAVALAIAAIPEALPTVCR